LGDADNVRASRTKAGPFEPLLSYAEFRDALAAEAAPAPAARPSSTATRAAATGANPNRPDTPTPASVRTPTARGSSGEHPRPPHIVLPPSENPGLAEAMRWGFLALVALVTGAVAYWLIPLFTRGWR
jgi:hypothetical protein